MLIKWIKKKILKSIINDLKKEMPHLKEEALKLLGVYKDELLEFCKKKLKDAIEEFINYKFNKTI